ncbi:MAG TPA: hypothetical protein VFK20_09520 [Vicinamibacterales bacterium]|nr:hypothetical protein [Vicinamibacterales bacterium]
MVRKFVRLPFSLAAALALPVAAAAQSLAVGPSVSNFSADLACAPVSMMEPPTAPLRIIASEEAAKYLYGPGDVLIVNAGANQGLKAGQQYFVRRVVHDRVTPEVQGFRPVSVHTAGWIVIRDVQANTARATVTHACDGMLEGDYLEPFAAPTVPEPLQAVGEPDYAHPARFIMGDERQQSAAAGSMLVLDRGRDAGLVAGQRLAIFRDTLGGAGPVVDVGDAYVVSLRPHTALVRITAVRDAIYVGDLVAPYAAR